MPSPRRTVGQSRRLLIRLGLCRHEALRTIMLVSAHGVARWRPTGLDVSWMAAVHDEAEKQLGAAPYPCKCNGEGGNTNARAT